MKGATAVLLLLSAMTHGAQFEVVPLPPIADDFTPEEQARIDRSYLAIPAPQLPEATPLPRIPWLEKEGDFWTGREAFFDLADFASGNRAMGWLALTDDHFLIHVEVDDATHSNDLAGTEMRKGDSLWVLFDAWGDDKRDRPYLHARSQSAWNALYVAALAKGKSHCRRESVTAGSSTGAGPVEMGKVRREGRETIYDLRIPWKDFGVTPGVVLHSSLAIRAHDSTNAAELFSHGTQWGGGALEKDQPTRDGIFTDLRFHTLQRVLFSPPARARAWATVTKRHFRQESDYGEIVVCTNMRGPLFAEVKAGGESRGILLQDDDPTLKWRRYGIRRIQQLKHGDEPVPFSVSVQSQAGELAKAETSLVPVFGDESVLEKALQPILESNSGNKLFQAHLQSLRRTDLLTWARHGKREERDLSLLQREAPAFRSEPRNIVKKLEGSLTQWQTFLARRAPLTIAVSTPDNSSGGACEVWLPKGFDPTKKYPAYLWTPGPSENPQERNAPEVFHKSIIDHGEGFAIRSQVHWSNDSSEVIRNTMLLLDHLLDQLPLDRDRLYLWGNTALVCGLGAAQPDKFAALAALSRHEPPNVFPGEDWDRHQQDGDHQWFKLAGSDACRNRSSLPIYYANARGPLLWHERLFNARKGQMKIDERERRTSWKANDGSLIIEAWDGVEARIGDQSKRISDWWQNMKRVRPEKLFYLKIHDLQIATWGVSMERNQNWQAYQAESWPRFECAIDGQTVRLSTFNCKHALIDLGPSGLQVKGEVILVWNGKTVHQGPVPSQSIKLK